MVCAGSKPVHIGYFDSQQGAARAYDQEAIRLRGPNTSLNFPITDYDVSTTHDLPFLECAAKLTRDLGYSIKQPRKCVVCGCSTKLFTC